MPASAAERDAAADEAVSQGRRSDRPANRLRDRLRGRGQFLAIWPALAVLLIASPFLAGGSLSHRALLTMVAFAGILAIAAIGQTLVIQQGGLDLSVPGSISLASVMVTQYTHAENSRAWFGIALALAVGAMGGLVCGIVVTRFGVTPLVATLGVNALFYAAVLQTTKGASDQTVPPVLDTFAVGRPLGIPNVAVVAVVLVIVVQCVIRFTVVGRRFVAIGANKRSARAAGLRVNRYLVVTYVAAGLSYAVAGILLASYLNTPNLLVGDTYLLPTVAAVVLGGTSLLGGAGSVVATAGGALFLIQLQQVVQGMGASAAVQNIITAAIIAVGMIARLVPTLSAKLRSRRPSKPSAPSAAPTASTNSTNTHASDPADSAGVRDTSTSAIPMTN